MSKNLYHYCSLDTFVAIISSKCLRLSDLNKTNDFMERKWVLSIIEEALNEFFQEKNIKINLREALDYGDGLNSHIDYIIWDLNLYINQSCFITCLSRNGDLLSQWRAYAGDGTGVAIGFNKKLLSNIGKRKSEVSLEPVLYNKKEQIEEVKYAASYAFDHFKRSDHDLAVQINEVFDNYFIEEIEGFCEVFAEEIAKISCYIKNPAFEEEVEERIYYAPFMCEFFDEENNESIQDLLIKTMRFNNFILNPICFNIRNNQVVGYVDLSFEKLTNKGIISEIVIGPSSRVTEKDIRFLLTKHGFNINNIEIYKSKATYQIK